MNTVHFNFINQELGPTWPCDKGHKLKMTWRPAVSRDDQIGNVSARTVIQMWKWLQCFQSTARWFSLFLFFLLTCVLPVMLFSFGEWSQPQYCPSGVLTSFQIRVEPSQGLFGDDTAVNNIKFRCSSNPTLEAPGMDWGDYGHWSQECGDGGICGIETKMEEYQYGLDDSSLNDVRFYCCGKSQEVSVRVKCGG